MVIKCQVAMVIATIAIIVIIATIGIIAMMMYADEVEEQVHGQCAGDLHYIPLAELLMAPITEIGPNWHQPTQPTQAGPAKGVAHQHRSTSSTSRTISRVFAFLAPVHQQCRQYSDLNPSECPPQDCSLAFLLGTTGRPVHCTADRTIFRSGS